MAIGQIMESCQTTLTSPNELEQRGHGVGTSTLISPGDEEESKLQTIVEGNRYRLLSQSIRANARNVRLHYPYWQYTDLFIFRFVSVIKLFTKAKGFYIYNCIIKQLLNSFFA